MTFVTILTFILSGIVLTWALRQRSRIAFLVVIAVFVSRPAVQVAGFGLRLEHVVAVVCLIDLLFSRRGRTSSMPPSVRASLALTIFWLAWVTVVSAYVAPIPRHSFAISTWIVANLITAVWVARTPELLSHILRLLCRVGMLVGFVAIAFYGVATTSGTEIFGVQVDPAYGGFAAYAFSIEANVLAGLMCLVGLLALANPRGVVGRWPRTLLPILTPLVIITTHTRAALIAYLLGTIILAVGRRASRRRSVWVGVLSAAASVGLIATSGDTGFSKFLDMFDIDSGTGGLRLEVNSLALEEWWNSSHRMIGLGLNSFGQRHYDMSQPGKMLPGYLGNLPIQLLYDGGLVAAVCILLAAATILGAYLRGRRFVIPLALVVAYLTFSVATSTLWLLETWLFVGMSWAGAGLLRADSSTAHDVLAQPCGSYTAGRRTS